MPRYIVRLYSDNKALIHDMRIECNRQDVPGRLACIVMDYLKGSPVGTYHPSECTSQAAGYCRGPTS